MTFKQQKQKIKEELKKIASDIRIGKSLRKPKHYEIASDKDQKMAQRLEYNQDYFRHKHIAYCMFFNKTPLGYIEKTEKYRSDYTIDRYKKEWKDAIEDYREDVRDCAA
jgi:hypothetical protein